MRCQSPEKNQKLMENIRSSLGGKFESVNENKNMVVIQANKNTFIELMNHLKTGRDFQFDVLMDLTAVDYTGKRDKRFEMVYMLLSSKTLSRIRIKLVVDEKEKVPSVFPVWKAANWPEREVFDLMGIEFEGHPLMERIIMPDGYIGHPLRKDFPLRGLGEDYLIESILRPVKDQPNTGL